MEPTSDYWKILEHDFPTSEKLLRSLTNAWIKRMEMTQKFKSKKQSQNQQDIDGQNEKLFSIYLRQN